MPSSPSILIDGSLGEGGGQILRSSLALSIITGQSFRIDKIRAGREKPGLLRQHLTAVNAAAQICDAVVDGALLGSMALTFTPGKIKPGEYSFSIGSAGSTMLVLQTVLPALLQADGPSTLVLEGGTHNTHAPPFDFIDRAFLPLLSRMGATVRAKLERAGFYPAGGGRVIVQIEPAKQWKPLHLLDRGEVKRKHAVAMVAALPGAIAKRELEKVAQRLTWSPEQLEIRQLPESWGPGNVLTIEIESEHVTEVFTGFGSKGITAEAVAEDVARQARRYLADNVPVGQYLADQLLLPLALAGGGAFRTQNPSQHTTTNIDVIRQFLGKKLTIIASERDRCIIESP
jgi:RNA 3'-terminal phosphate cyclase (ATP)